MALSPQVVALTVQAIELLKKQNPGRPKVASLGYPDILLSRDQIKELFGIDGLQSRSDANEISNFHGRGDLDIPDGGSFFERLGCDLTVLDIKEWRGGEVCADLNYPIKSRKLLGRFDLVINNGTTEHCFNVVEAMINILKITAAGGYILDWGPSNMPNHGFWSFNPTLYHDFYGENGGVVVHQSAWNFEKVDGNTVEVQHPVHPTGRYHLPGYNTSLLTLTHKRVKLKEIKYPIQSKYRAMGLT